MSVETGFDYSATVQGLLTPQLAASFAAAGLERCALALDTSPDTLQSARNLAQAGIALDAYRELSVPAQYVSQAQNALAAFDLLSPEGIYFRRLWLTVEDLSASPVGHTFLTDPHDRFWRRRLRRGLSRLKPQNEPIATMSVAILAGLHAAVTVCAGYDVGLYTGAWYWPVYLPGVTDFANLPLWHASYDGLAALGPVAYGGWSRMNAKQYASPVTVADVALDVDVFAV